MRYPLLFSILISVFFLSCNKDKFNTKPSLKFKSVNTTTLQQGGNLIFTLSFTDAEGDLTDNLVISKFEPNCIASRKDTIKYPLPAFPAGKNQKGDIIVTFDYNGIAPRCFPRNDTAVFKFVLRDKAQNSSDTALSPAIVIVNQ
ncbi:MAG: hypothetical protein ABJA90_03915 [Ginsengibacter sp.]